MFIVLSFLANVKYVVVRPSVCRLSVVCLSVVCNVRAPYSADWNFPQCFCAI